MPLSVSYLGLWLKLRGWTDLTPLLIQSLSHLYRPWLEETCRTAPFALSGRSVSIWTDLKQVKIQIGSKLCFYLDRTKAGENPDRFKRLFVSFKPGHKGDLVKVTISGWIKVLIKSAYEKVESDDVPHLTHRNFQARELRAMATSLADLLKLMILEKNNMAKIPNISDIIQGRIPNVSNQE
jgi:hypothetical protein